MIVGAGFAGIAAAQRLGPGCTVTVIDRSPWFEWLPNVHELLSGVKRPSELRLARARLVRRAGHRFVRAEVDRVDGDAGVVTTSSGRRIAFDTCIVAVGGEGETFGIPGVARFAMPFKSVQHCSAIGRALAGLARREGRASIVIVGGGLEGVEALGEILRRYGRSPAFGITVIEAGPRLMPGVAPALDRAVRRHCEPYHVRFLTGVRVTRVTRTQVRLDDGRSLRADVTLWTGGVTAPRLLERSGLAAGPRQWADVDATLRSKRFANVFVIGDAARLPHPLSKQAYYALQMGVHAADNVRRVLAGRRLREFKPAPKPMLVAFGALDTFLVSGRSVIASPALAAAKEAIFQATMAQLDPPRDRAGLQALARRAAGAGRRWFTL